MIGAAAVSPLACRAFLMVARTAEAALGANRIVLCAIADNRRDEVTRENKPVVGGEGLKMGQL